MTSDAPRRAVRSLRAHDRDRGRRNRVARRGPRRWGAARPRERAATAAGAPRRRRTRLRRRAARPRERGAAARRPRRGDRRMECAPAARHADETLPGRHDPPRLRRPARPHRPELRRRRRRHHRPQPRRAAHLPPHRPDIPGRQRERSAGADRQRPRWLPERLVADQGFELDVGPQSAERVVEMADRHADVVKIALEPGPGPGRRCPPSRCGRSSRRRTRAASS